MTHEIPLLDDRGHRLGWISVAGELLRGEAFRLIERSNEPICFEPGPLGPSTINTVEFRVRPRPGGRFDVWTKADRDQLMRLDEFRDREGVKAAIQALDRWRDAAGDLIARRSALNNVDLRGDLGTRALALEALQKRVQEAQAKEWRAKHDAMAAVMLVKCHNRLNELPDEAGYLLAEELAPA